jgi:hypothetical protein
LKFDSVVFADDASTAALSCFARLISERESGRKTLIVPLENAAGADAVEGRSLAIVRRFDDVETHEGGAGPGRPIRERFAVLIRKLGPKHVLAPIGLLNAPRSIDYFGALRDAMSVDKGRDLLFFEERPQALIPEATPLRLGGLGVRLPPASRLRLARAFGSFRARLITGIGVPPIFGGLRERGRFSETIRSAFRETADWDPFRALGPKLQPLTEPFRDSDIAELFALAAELGVETGLGSKKAFRRRLARIASGAGSDTFVERYWLSLPSEESAAMTAEGM